MNGDELNLILPKFARLPFLSPHAYWHFHKEILVEENAQYFCISVYNFFTAKHYRSRCRSGWENLDHWSISILADQIREFGP